MNWREQVTKKVQGFGFPTGLSDRELWELRLFISDDIIEEIIKDIGKMNLWSKGTVEGTKKDIQQRLKKKWL